jgi:phage RecT family recombinase
MTMTADAKTVTKIADSTPKLSEELAGLQPEVQKVLPEHVSADKFMRVVLTAISQNPKLYKADRRSLLTSCIKCAQDGLLPDGREAALVIYRSKDKAIDARTGKEMDRWIDKVQYLPMVAGVLKKVRNSGELLSITANVVYEQDKFRYWIDDAGEHVMHEPNVLEDNRGKFLAVYAIAKTKDGGVYTEIMSRGQIDQVRSVSRAKDDGPWISWPDEMARKSVIRRLAKRLPMSTDLERVIRRDDAHDDLRQVTTTATGGNIAVREALGPLKPSILERARSHRQTMRMPKPRQSAPPSRARRNRLLDHEPAPAPRLHHIAPGPRGRRLSAVAGALRCHARRGRRAPGVRGHRAQDCRRRHPARGSPRITREECRMTAPASYSDAVNLLEIREAQIGRLEADNTDLRQQLTTALARAANAEHEREELQKRLDAVYAEGDAWYDHSEDNDHYLMAPIGAMMGIAKGDGT